MLGRIMFRVNDNVITSTAVYQCASARLKDGSYVLKVEIKGADGCVDKVAIEMDRTDAERACGMLLKDGYINLSKYEAQFI